MVVNRTKQKQNAPALLLPKCLKPSDVPTEFAEEQNKDEVLEGKFRNLNFSPSTKKTTEYSFELFFPFVDISIFFSSFKLQYCRTIVLLNSLSF